MTNLHALPVLLRFYQSLGVDTLLDDFPRNHYAPVESVKNILKSSSAPPLISEKMPPSQLHSVSDTQSGALPDTLIGLRAFIENSTGCDLIKLATHTVFASGDAKAQVMFVGEAPGVDEDKEGLPFVGQSGQLLDAILASIGLNRRNIYITNIVPWRPPGNRPPTASEIAYCLPFIRQHIKLVAPKILVLLGGVATKTLLQRNDGILKLRGTLFAYDPGQECQEIETSHIESALVDEAKILALPTFHPAYIMRSPSQKRLVWKDMLILKKCLENLSQGEN
jgi:DNA polymerase